jgi:coenzyme PQQ precursor peptide PqqA
MRHWFDGTRYRPGKYCAAQYLHRRRRREKIPLANFLICITLSKGRNSSGLTFRRAKMAWKAPKIVEVPVGMEINMYACAARK